MLGQVRAYGIAALAAAALCASTAPPVHAQADTIRIGLQSVPVDEVIASKDWGADHDLKLNIQFYSNGGNMLKAFLAGQVDIVNGGSARLVQIAAQQPEKFYIITANQYGGGRYGIIVPPDSTVKSIAELKGKKIGGVTGSGTFSTFRVYLEQNGMKESDFQIVNMDVAELPTGLQQGIIQAGVAWEPYVAIPEVMGTAKRLTSLEGVNESPNFSLVNREFADKHPEAVTKYVSMLIELGDFIKNTPDQAGEMAAKQMSAKGVRVDPKALGLAMTRIKMDPKITDELLSELMPVAESMKAAGKIASVPDFKALVNSTFYDNAMKKKTASKAP